VASCCECGDEPSGSCATELVIPFRLPFLVPSSCSSVLYFHSTPFPPFIAFLCCSSFILFDSIRISLLFSLFYNLSVFSQFTFYLSALFCFRQASFLSSKLVSVFLAFFSPFSHSVCLYTLPSSASFLCSFRPSNFACLPFIRYIQDSFTAFFPYICLLIFYFLPFPP
jgi:hypothetical protein